MQNTLLQLLLFLLFSVYDGLKLWLNSYLLLLQHSEPFRIIRGPTSCQSTRGFVACFVR